tara:strand:- start:376 stop:1854 length:1479 start_codon:yes stop_codon:yes gene_type:complete
MKHLKKLFFLLLITISCQNESVDIFNADADQDGFYDSIDNCPDVSNESQTDSNGDGIGDSCSDLDFDGIIDSEDNCYLNFNPDQTDSDGDGVGDNCDLVDFISLNCINGFAGEYPCNEFNLLGHLSIEGLSINYESNIRVNDSWGWKDPLNGDEYAIIGLSSHTAFVNMSDPKNLTLVGILPSATVNSIWRDIKVYNNHAYIVSEASNHGMQVFDLTKLRNVENSPITFIADYHFTDFGRAHNIVINEDTGYAYPVGNQDPGRNFSRDPGHESGGLFDGGPIFINIQNPTNPVLEGGFSEAGYSHDAQSVIYNGPDQDYIGKEIIIGCNQNHVDIVDITDKSNPVYISSISYDNVHYTHQGWLTEDHKFFIVGDELDEVADGINTRSIVLDLSDLDNPLIHFDYNGPTFAIDHNGYVKGDKFYLASYKAGMREIDISQIGSKNMYETGFFDTFPDGEGSGFSGAWSVYPFFDSQNIIISDIQGGLFVVSKNN